MIKKVSIRNYKAFQSVELDGLSPMSVFIGANGSGKSTWFDVFDFLRDALQNDLLMAIERRGGWNSVHSRGASERYISIELQYWVTRNKRRVLAEYTLKSDFSDRRYGTEERLRIREKDGRWSDYLKIKDGKGFANDDGLLFGVKELENTMRVDLETPTVLALKPLGQYAQFRCLVDLRKLLERYIIFEPNTPALLSPTTADRAIHLQNKGQNLTQIARYYREEHPDTFTDIVKKMGRRIPGLGDVTVTETIDGRIVLGFADKHFGDPFSPKQTSDGTLKMFAYLLLINHPDPAPLLALEEPENYLHPDLHQILAEEIRGYARRGGQVFVSTHSRDFLNALKLEELFWLEKERGYSVVKRAVDDPMAKALHDQGDQLGYLWRTNHFAGSGPLNTPQK